MIEIPNTEETIAGPIITAVIEDLKRLTGLPLDTPVRRSISDTGVAKAGTTVGLTGYDRKDNEINTASNRKIAVEYNEMVTEDMVLATPMFDGIERYAFYDKELGIKITPVYSSSKMELSMEIRFESKNEAIMWGKQINNAIRMGGEIKRHTVKYAYVIPTACMAGLMKMYELREAVAGYNQTFAEWCKSCFHKNFTVLTNLAGGQPTVAIAETDVDIAGGFDIEALQRPERSSEAGGYMYALNYILNYRRPSSVTMEFPTSIHQQLVPKPFIDEAREPFDHQLTETISNLFGMAGRGITNKRLPVTFKKYGFRSPWYDGWIPTLVLPDTAPIVTVLLSMSDGLNQMPLESLQELIDYPLDDDVIEYIKEAHEFVCKPRHAPILFTLYEDKLIHDHDSLMLEDDGMLSVIKDINLRKDYRLMISVYGRLSLLPKESKEILKRHPRALIKIASTLCPSIKPEQYPKLDADGYVTEIEYNRFINLTELCALQPEHAINGYKGNNLELKPLGQFGIIAHRFKEDNLK